MFDQIINQMHLGRILPEILVLVVVMAALLVDVILPRGRTTRAVQITSGLGLLLVIIVSILTRGQRVRLSVT